MTQPIDHHASTAQPKDAKMIPPISLSLLVVDDDELNRDMLCRRLAREGYTTHGAEDGHQALELVRRHKFDLILLDVTMPGLDGLVLL
jgi:CheY-like chemotaxis protein